MKLRFSALSRNFSPIILPDASPVLFIIHQNTPERDKSRSDIAWSVHDKLSNNLLNPEYEAYGWALKVKQQLIDRGVKFPPLSPREVRWKEGKPNRFDIKAREKERLENPGN